MRSRSLSTIKFSAISDSKNCKKNLRFEPIFDPAIDFWHFSVLSHCSCWQRGPSGYNFYIERKSVGVAGWSEVQFLRKNRDFVQILVNVDKDSRSQFLCRPKQLPQTQRLSPMWALSSGNISLYTDHCDLLANKNFLYSLAFFESRVISFSLQKNIYAQRTRFLFFSRWKALLLSTSICLEVCGNQLWPQTEPIFGFPEVPTTFWPAVYVY